MDRINIPLLVTQLHMETVVKKIRRYQTHEIYRHRTTFGEYHYLMSILRKYPEKFKQYLRMETHTFDYILSKINLKLTKKWCNLHTQPIYPEERLVLTLRFLATGSTYTHLSFSFMMGISTVSTIILETMRVLWDTLWPLHMPIPSTEQFLRISADFYEKRNFPHCVGAIDGRHVRIKKPPRSKLRFRNYKKFYSIVLQAVVDANHRYIAIDVGGRGRQSDGGTFMASDLYKLLINKKIKFPESDRLPNSNVILPYFLVGDGAYPLMENLMKPYRGKNLPRHRIQFNRRLSRARVTVENTFGYTSQKWRIYYTTIDKTPKVVNSIVKCTCLLHNVIIDNENLNFFSNSMATAQMEHCGLVPLEHQENEFTFGSAPEMQFELAKYILKNPL